MWNIKSAPIVRATYLLEKYLEERIIATYLLLLQQPIYYFSFWQQPISKLDARALSLTPWVKPCVEAALELQSGGGEVRAEGGHLKPHSG